MGRGQAFRRQLRVSLAALALAALGAGDAYGAAPVRVGTAQSLDQGPLLAGDAFAYAQASPTRFSVRVVRRGARPSVLARGRLFNLETEFTLTEEFVTLAASAQRLAFTRFFSGSAKAEGKSDSALDSGPVSGPLTRVAACDSRALTETGVETASSLVDVSGAAVAYVDCQGRVTVRDFAPGAAVPSRTIPAGANVDDLSLGGRYVAFRAERSIRVFDWVANAQAYTVPLPGADSTAFDLQPDGTLAVGRARDVAVSCPAGSLAWYSRAQPFAHQLGLAPCSAQVVIAAGRIALVTRAGSNRRALTTVTLAGARTNVASLGADGMQAGEFDLDASRASFALRNCLAGADLLRAAVPGSVPLPFVTTTCPVSIRSRETTLRQRAVRVRVVCRRGCAGRARLVRRAGTRLVGLGPAKAVKLGASRRSRRVRLPLSRAARRLLARKGTLRAQLRIAVTDRNGRERLARRTLILSAR